MEKRLGILKGEFVKIKYARCGHEEPRYIVYRNKLEKKDKAKDFAKHSVCFKCFVEGAKAK